MPVAALPVPAPPPTTPRVPAPRTPTYPDVARPGRRPRSDPARHHSSGFVGALNREWQQLAASPGATATLATWRRHHPEALQHVTALDELERYASGAHLADPAARRTRRDAVLHALVDLAHRGDQLAVRSITQLLLGDLVSMARRLRRTHGASTDDLHVDLVGWLVLVIPACPTAHPGGTATRLTLDTLKRHTREQQKRPDEVPLTEDHELLPSPSTCATDLPLTEVLAWAVRSDVVSLTEATWLVRLADQGPHGHDLQSLAQELGITYLAMRKRVSRLKQRLAEHVRAIVETPVGSLQGMYELEPTAHHARGRAA